MSLFTIVYLRLSSGWCISIRSTWSEFFISCPFSIFLSTLALFKSFNNNESNMISTVPLVVNEPRTPNPEGIIIKRFSKYGLKCMIGRKINKVSCIYTYSVVVVIGSFSFFVKKEKLFEHADFGSFWRSALKPDISHEEFFFILDPKYLE